MVLLAWKRAEEDVWFLFFFQAEDGIRDWSVTGVQTCALPIFRRAQPIERSALSTDSQRGSRTARRVTLCTAGRPRRTRRSISPARRRRACRIVGKIGRASCRERE